MSGKRNEPARARRRRKQDGASMPIGEGKSRAALPRYTLDNHFGWRVLYKTQLDDSAGIPLLHMYEKPDTTGREFQKVTHVVYADEGDTYDRETAVKVTQTDPIGILREKKPKPVSKTTLPPKEQEKKKKEDEYTEREEVADTRSELSRRSPSVRSAESIYEQVKPKRKRRLISDFYFKPRSNSRAKSKDKFKVGDSNMEGQRSEIVIEPEEEEELKEIEEEKREQEKEKKPDKKRGKGPDRWALRAGAENKADELRNCNKVNDRKSSAAVRTESKLIERLKYDPVKYGREKPSEHLLQTPSRTNQYLYVARDRRKKKTDEPK